MKPEKNQFLLLTFILITCFFALPGKAQVVIGDITNPPHTFSLLEIISNNATPGGLRMPLLSTEQRDDILQFKERFVDVTPVGEEADLAIEAKGLWIFNTTTKCLEFWNTKTWVSLCAGTSDDDDDCTGPELLDGIYGAILVYAGETNLYYSATKLPGVTYTWTLPAANWAKTLGGTSYQIEVTAGHLGDDGDISLTTKKGECDGDGATLAVEVYKLGCCSAPPRILNLQYGSH